MPKPAFNLNLLGPYGNWAAEHLGTTPGPLSFLNKKWSDLEGWKLEARKKFFELIAMPVPGAGGSARVMRRYTYDGLAVEELSWSLPYGPATEAVFLKPQKHRGKLPGILALHDHGGIKYFGKSKITRTTERIHPFVENHQKEYYGGVPWANELAKRGYGILIHDVFPFESRKIPASQLPAHTVRRMMTPPLEKEEVKPEDLTADESNFDYDVSPEEPLSSIAVYNSFGEQHESIIAKSLFSAGLTWPGMFLAEDRYALDVLASRNDIDEARLGCCGLSGGGLRTNYLAGSDDRVKCSVTVGFMTTWRDLILNVSYTHTWMVYVPLLPRFFDFPEILGMRVPAPAMVQATTQDPLYTFKEVERSAELLSSVYQKAENADTFKFSSYEGPHKFDRTMQEDAFEWLDRWLARNPGKEQH